MILAEDTFRDARLRAAYLATVSASQVLKLRKLNFACIFPLDIKHR